MSLQKIGNLTNAVNTLKKKSGTGKDIISTLSSFGDLSTAAKYLVSTNKKGEKTLSEKTLFNLLKGAYGNLGEEAISEALKQGIKTSSIKGALSSGISGLVSGIGAAGTGILSVLSSIWPLLAVGGGIFAGVKGYQALNDKFTLTKGMADKHYSQSTQEYANNQSELESLQSQRDSNQERIYELRAKENKSTDEKAELSQLQEENNLLDSQVAIKEKSVDVSKLQAANDAKTKLEKKGYQKNYKKEAYDNQDKTSINDLDEASEMIDYLNQLKSEYKDRVQKIADEGREPSWIEQKGLDSTKKKIDSLESDVADKVTEISDTAKSMKNACRIVSISFSDPPKALLCFRIISFAATDFFVTRCVPGFWPICLPANLAVSIPSAVLWCKSCTSFSACSNASLICSLANARRYLFTPSRIKSTLVPVAGIPPCKALLYVSVLMCGSFRNTRLIPWLKSS